MLAKLTNKSTMLAKIGVISKDTSPISGPYKSAGITAILTSAHYECIIRIDYRIGASILAETAWSMTFLNLRLAERTHMQGNITSAIAMPAFRCCSRKRCTRNSFCITPGALMGICSCETRKGCVGHWIERKNKN